LYVEEEDAGKPRDPEAVELEAKIGSPPSSPRPKSI
jgi:hypothetical protein